MYIICLMSVLTFFNKNKFKKTMAISQNTILAWATTLLPRRAGRYVVRQHFGQVWSGNHQNPYSSYIFYGFVPQGFCKWLSSWIFWFRALKNWVQNPKKPGVCFDIWAQISLQSLIKNLRTKLFAKSIFTSVLKVSDRCIEECRRSRDFHPTVFISWSIGSIAPTKNFSTKLVHLTPLHTLFGLFYTRKILKINFGHDAFTLYTWNVFFQK